jgi:hypothetical protein
LTGIPLRIAEPAVVTRAGWQCPGCRTYYSPDVQSCAADRPLSERITRERPIKLGGPCISGPVPYRATFPEVRC